MKSIKTLFAFSLLLSCMIAGLSSCEEGNLADTNNWKTGLYFQKDSITYSFGVTPIEVTEYTLKVPLRVMGNKSSEQRAFEIKINNDKTTAEKSVHYDLDNAFTVEKDSINAYLNLKIKRSALEGNNNYRVAINLVENQNFAPVNEKYKSIVIYFNNRVDPPDWKDWQGKPTWPDFKLGKWNPLTYIKFIELFRNMEVTAPSTYKNMVAEFGKDLKNVQYGWPWDYDQSMTKYILIPLYQYFMEENPSLGVTIPRPLGY